jgi:predicted TIM-barrel fold metal-dependent hydrolase
MEAGTSVDELVASMDESNVEKCVITPPSYVYDFDSVDEECSVVSDVRDHSPDRFGGALMLENTREATRRFVTSVEEYGFVAGRIMPSMVGDSGVPPTDRGFYPIYHEAEKRDIPITINAGIPGPVRPAKTQRPLHLDEICLEFPDLSIVATHMGDPWTDELVALCNKHPNLHMMTSAWKPEYYPEDVIEYLNSSRGIDDVMYASDWPLLDWTDTLPQVSDLELSEEATRKFLYDNANRVFDI